MSLDRLKRSQPPSSISVVPDTAEQMLGLFYVEIPWDLLRNPRKADTIEGIHWQQIASNEPLAKQKHVANAPATRHRRPLTFSRTASDPAFNDRDCDFGKSRRAGEFDEALDGVTVASNRVAGLPFHDQAVLAKSIVPGQQLRGHWERERERNDRMT